MTENNPSPTLKVLVGHRLDRTIAIRTMGRDAERTPSIVPLFPPTREIPPLHTGGAVPNHPGKLPFAVPRVDGREYAGAGEKVRWMGNNGLFPKMEGSTFVIKQGQTNQLIEKSRPTQSQECNSEWMKT
jgi:hypothetical protein